MHWRIRARSVKPNILSSLSSAFYHGGKGRTRRICIGGDGYFFGSFGLDCCRYLHWHHESNTARQLGLSSVGCMCVYHFFSACRLSYSLGAKSHNKWRPGKTGSPPAVALLLFSSRMAHMQRPVLPWAHCPRVRVRLPRSATAGASRNSPFAQASACPVFFHLLYRAWRRRSPPACAANTALRQGGKPWVISFPLAGGRLVPWPAALSECCTLPPLCRSWGDGPAALPGRADREAA